MLKLTQVDSPFLAKTRSGWFWPAWIVGGMVAALAWGVLALGQPQTELSLGPASGDNALAGFNSFVTLHRIGFGPVAADGGSQPIATGATLRAEAFSYRPLTLHLDIRGGRGSLQVAVNGQLIGAVAGPELAGSYRFSFLPQRPPDEKPQLHFLFTLKDSDSPWQLSDLTLDLTEQWQPLDEASSRELAIALGLALGLLLGAGLMARRKGSAGVGWLALLGGASAAGLVVYRLGLQVAVGSGGELNSLVYWGWLAASLYLLVFLAGFGLTLVPVRAGRSLTELTQQPARLWADRHPFRAAAVSLGVFNALLMTAFVGVVALQNNSFDNLGRFWDGPEYLVLSHSLYDPTDPLLQIPAFAAKSHFYWAAHFPLYPLLVRLFAEPFGYLPGLLIPNFLFGTGFALALYRFLKDFGYSRHPLWLSGLALFLPLRWLIYHSVGSSEAVTLFFLVLSVYAFKRERYGLAGLWGTAVVLTRPNGIFLYTGLTLVLLWQAFEPSRQAEPDLKLKLKWDEWLRRGLARFNWRGFAALSLMPLALLLVFALFAWRLGDFWAYLRIPEDVKHIYPLPFTSLDVNVGRGEGDFYYYLLEAAGLSLLWQRKHYDLFWLSLALAGPTFFLLHDDILRYSLPAFPFVLLVPFAAVLESRVARWLALPTLLAVLIYSWSQLNTNLVDPETWRAMRVLLP